MLKLKNVNIHYGKVQALHDVSIDVEQGEIVALLGANGAGKSTVINTISGIVKPSSGTLEFMGESIHDKSAAEIVQRGIIQCPEGRQIFPSFTVAENLRIGAYCCRDKKKVGENYERVYTLFPRLKERAAQSAGTLSGGEQQMLAIGRALMAAPRVLLLDEPSLGLSPIIIRDIFKTIRDINSSGTTILLVEQNVKMSLAVANRAYVLELGHIALSGTTEELRSNDEIRKLYLGAH